MTETPLEALIAKLTAGDAWSCCCIRCGRLLVSWQGGHRVIDEGANRCGDTIERIPNSTAIAALRARAALAREVG